MSIYIWSNAENEIIITVFGITTLASLLILVIFFTLEVGPLKIIKTTFHIFTLYVPLFIYLCFSNKKECSGCGSSKITFISLNKGKPYWKYKNKDGTRNKKRINNSELVPFTSIYKCTKCYTETKFYYNDSSDPNQNNKITKQMSLG